MQKWARFIGRSSWLWIIVWPVVALLLWLPAPRIPTLLADDDTGFLPADMPSQQAFAKLKEEFPDNAPANRAAVVCVRESGLTAGDRARIAELARALAGRSNELGWQVRAVAVTPYLGSFLESPDGEAAVIALDLPATLLTHSTVNRVREIQQAIARLTREPGLEIEVTGTGALGELLDTNTKRDVDRTTAWAFAAVTIILLLVYRSPVAMLLPLVTIALSLMVALGLLGWAASHGLPINGLVEMFIIVIVVGSGVDYCLFLFARFREEMARNPGVRPAIEVAVSRTGGAILASAGTNAVGLATLALARNRDLYTSGPTIALAICIATFAVLTLAPSLMQIVGHRLVWPRSLNATREPDRTLWKGVARIATHHPVTAVLAILMVLIPAAILGTRVEPLYDSYEEYPPDSSFVRGARLYHEHFFQSAGVSEQTLILSTARRLDTPQALPILKQTFDDIYTALANRFPLVYQRDLPDPLGNRRPVAAGGDPTLSDRLVAGVSERPARDYYLGRSGKAARADFALRVEPRSTETLELLPDIRAAIQSAVDQGGLAVVTGGSAVEVDLAGETPLYADIRNVRIRDFRVIAVVAVVLIYLILVALIRSLTQSAILIAATLLTYLATYGATWAVFRTVFGVSSLTYQLGFLLFIIILALGQDYNIYVVSRIREERRGRPLPDAVGTAVSKTGRVVSSCGLIMAAAFGSMFSGSLLLMKEFAVALALGILIDTFLVRPLLVPALILLLGDRTNTPEAKPIRTQRGPLAS